MCSSLQTLRNTSSRLQTNNPQLRIPNSFFLASNVLKVVSNVTATEYKDADEIKKLLIKQIESPVRWRESIEYMISQGSSSFIEIGPGKVLSGLIKRINKEVKVLNIDRLEDIQDIKL